MLDEEIKQIVLQNQVTLEKINKKLKWQTRWGILKAVFIIGPIVLGIIWLVPFFQKYFPEIKSALDTIRLGLLNIQGGLTSGNISPDQQEMICNEDLREQVIRQICR